MSDEIRLEREQRELLMALVEATRRAGPENRQAFWLLRVPSASGQLSLSHPGLPDGGIGVYMVDVETLAEAGLIRLKADKPGVWQFDVRPPGHEFYRREKLKAGQPVERVEETVRCLLAGDAFQKRHVAAYQKWTQAEDLLWGSDSQAQLTTIGHLCREAMQEFASSLCAAHNVTPPDSNPANTVNRVRAVLKHAGASLGETTRAFLDALLVYWGTVSDLVQRQEHGAQKEGEPLAWEDGRRVVFQTLLVMYEVDQALSPVRRAPFRG